MHPRLDGLVNALTGLGDEDLDTRQATQRTAARWRTPAEYEQEWRQSWMANREISQRARDMFREGFDLEDLEPADLDLARIRSFVQGDLKTLPDGRLDTQKGLLWYARRWLEIGDKVGGSALMPILDDGLDPSRPLDVRRIQRVIGWEVFDRSEILPHWGTGSFTSKPTHYVLADVAQDLMSGKDRTFRPGDVIHASRLFINPGRELSAREMRRRQGWGDSMLELLWNERRAAEEGAEYARTYMDRVSWLHMQIAGLTEMLEATDQNGNPIGEVALKTRMRTFRRLTRTLGMGITDGGVPEGKERTGETIPGRSPDKLESMAESVGDLPELVQMNLDHWQFGLGMPKTLAFGEAPGGLRGGDNAGDWQSWGGVIAADQDEKATPVMTWMLVITFASREGPTDGVIPTNFSIAWRPLTIPTPIEEIEIDKARAEVDGLRLAQKVITPAEVREQRIINGDEGPLRVEESTDKPTLPIDPSLAASIFAGAQAVTSGAIPVEFFAAWLHVTAPDLFPPRVAATLAASLRSQPAAVEGDGVELEAAGSDVQQQVLNGAQISALAEVVTSVSAGAMAAEVGSWLVRLAVPGLTMAEVQSAMAQAAEFGATRVPMAEGQPAAPGSGEAAPGSAPAGDPDAGPVADEETEDPDPLSVAFSSDPIPKDLATPREIAQQLTAEWRMKVSTLRVTNLARKGLIRTWSILGKPGVSLAEVRAVIAGDNGLLEPDERAESEQVEDELAEDAAAPDGNSEASESDDEPEQA